MKVTVSAGGLWHASALVPYLQKESMLHKFFTSLPRFKLPETFRQAGYVKSYGYLDVAQYALRKFVRQDASVQKARMFDLAVSRALTPTDLFVVWSSFGMNSIARAKELGAITLVERGSAHILEQERLLEEAYELAGISRNSSGIIDSRIIEREIVEYESADYISVPSHFARESFVRRGVEPRKLIMVPYGVDTRLFNRSYDEQEPTDDALKIVFAGAVGVRKGIPTLVKAIRMVRNELPVSVCLAGPISGELDPKTIQSDDFKLLGKLSVLELAQLFRTSNVFVLPSVEEGLARVVLEAMACGLCPICSTHTGAADVIQHGQNGYLFEPHDFEELGRLIVSLGRDRHRLEEMSRNARETAQQFTWDRYGREMVDIYRHLNSPVPSTEG